MLVETYEVPEVDHEGTPECEEEALALIEKLGLEGQRSLVVRDDEGGETRCPYRKMTKEEAFVYGTLFPKKTKVADYSDGMIPLRVLQIAAHAVDLFDHVYVWHPENADEKDPILVGMNGSEYSSNERYMLARWGEVLVPFGELLTKAAARFRANRKAGLLEIISRCKALVESCDSIPDEACADTKKPTFYE